MLHFILAYFGDVHKWSSVAIAELHSWLPFILASLREMILPMAAMVALCVLPMAHPRTRRVTVSVMRYSKRHAPRWLAPLLVACAFIPGPIDELLVIAAALYPVLKSAHNRRVFARTVSYAWNR